MLMALRTEVLPVEEDTNMEWRKARTTTEVELELEISIKLVIFNIYLPLLFLSKRPRGNDIPAGPDLRV